MELPHFEGWHLIGAFPDGVPDDVGSWLLVHDGEAMLLEVPPGLTVEAVQATLDETGTTLRYVTASHDHEDHLDPEAWSALEAAFPEAEFSSPDTIFGDQVLSLGGEPVWLIKAPKHSRTDVVTVFRGVAMTGDIELGMLESVNNEVPLRTKKRSMRWLQDFGDRQGYRIHSTVSAHLNDARVAIEWPELFEIEAK